MADFDEHCEFPRRAVPLEVVLRQICDHFYAPYKNAPTNKKVQSTVCRNALDADVQKSKLLCPVAVHNSVPGRL